jgi:hypothetical protein
MCKLCLNTADIVQADFLGIQGNTTFLCCWKTKILKSFLKFWAVASAFGFKGARKADSELQYILYSRGEKKFMNYGSS